MWNVIKIGNYAFLPIQDNCIISLVEIVWNPNLLHLFQRTASKEKKNNIVCNSIFFHLTWHREQGRTNSRKRKSASPKQREKHIYAFKTLGEGSSCWNNLFSIMIANSWSRFKFLTIVIQCCMVKKSQIPFLWQGWQGERFRIKCWFINKRSLSHLPFTL